MGAPPICRGQRDVVPSQRIHRRQQGGDCRLEMPPPGSCRGQRPPEDMKQNHALHCVASRCPLMRTSECGLQEHAERCDNPHMGLQVIRGDQASSTAAAATPGESKTLPSFGAAVSHFPALAPQNSCGSEHILSDAPRSHCFARTEWASCTQSD